MINRNNYSAIEDYLDYQADVLQRDKETIDRKRLLLRHLIRWADDAPITQANKITPVYPRYLATAKRADRGDVPLSAVGVNKCCREARAFFKWARQNKREYRDISEAWIETVYPPRMATEPRKEHQFVTPEMIRAIIALPVPAGDIGLERDKAAAAFLFLSGCRASAFCTLTIERVSIDERTVEQYPTLGVKTKNRKSGKTSLLCIPDILMAASEWDSFVRARLPVTAPWYPVIDISMGEQRLTDSMPGESRGGNLSKRIKRLFKMAGLPPMSAHKFRHGHAVFGMKASKDLSDLKAVSQNLMHSSIGITDSIYAVLGDKDLQERIGNLGEAIEQHGKDGGHNPGTYSQEEIDAAVALLKKLKSV